MPVALKRFRALVVRVVLAVGKTPNPPYNGARPLPLPAPVLDNQKTYRDD